MAQSLKSLPRQDAPEERPNTPAPTISLPKGGGAIRGIGEKFAANPVTGTGSMSVPIATSPGRAGFGPQLALSYDSGSGNGPFGFGWNLPLPAITRKTDKGLPRYFDAVESDVFILSGAEDLVPTLVKTGTDWQYEPVPPRTVDGLTYAIRRYRPRIESQFARIERWTNTADPADVHWRSITKDNVLTLYGRDANSRICDPDPANAGHIFSWLICETRDDKGSAILYEYQPEDDRGLSLALLNEANRGIKGDKRRKVNRYIKRIRYGNQKTLLENGKRPAFLSPTAVANAGWMFEAVFDYGEHAELTPTPGDSADWALRADPFSSYRAGFEVRTYRICKRVLMFHHFENEDSVGKDCLVRSTDFTYSQGLDPKVTGGPAYTFLLAVTQSGYKRAGGGYLKRSLPPVVFEYSPAAVQDTLLAVDAGSLENLPVGLDGAVYQWTDLHGEGIPGLLTEQAGAWFYKRNLSPISDQLNGPAPASQAMFAPEELVTAQPNVKLSGGAAFMDLAGDGQPDLVMLDGPLAGFFEHDTAEGWLPFSPFTARLSRDMRDPNLKLVDLDGDGHADVLVTEEDALVWHPSLAEAGFGPAQRVAQALDEEKGPRLVFADGEQSIYLADFSGDGLTDLVRVRNGAVCYWPNLGYGRFGAKVAMDNAPWFDAPDQFNQERIRLADIDGSGTTDIIYLGRDGVRLYFNQSGNSWSAIPQLLKAFPREDALSRVMPVDLLGNGTTCLVWSSPLPGDSAQPMRYINLMGDQKPHLLIGIKNNLGAETRVQYAPSTKFYLQDRYAGAPWITRLPFPVHVVESVSVTDKWRGTTFTSTYSYHHGYFDGVEREFRGFGRVEQVDVESYGKFSQDNHTSPYITKDRRLFQPPVKTTSWFHTGVFLDHDHILSHYEQEYFPHWVKALAPGTVNFVRSFDEISLPEPDLDAEDLTTEEWREALRACKGMLLRQEVVELDVAALEQPGHPRQVPVRLFSSAYHNCAVRRLQPQGNNRHAVFLVAESEAITYHYELDLHPDKLSQLAPDPRIAHTLNLMFDEYANVLQSAAVVYPRLGKLTDDPDLAAGLATSLPVIDRVQRVETHLTYTETGYTKDFDLKDPDNYRLRLPCEVRTYDLTGIKPEDADDLLTPDPRDNLYFSIDELRRFRLSQDYQSSGDAVTEIAYHQIASGAAPQKRLIQHTRTLFFAENLAQPLPFKELGRLGLTFETYTLALTDALLDAVFKDGGGHKLDQTIDGAITARARLNDPARAGYLSGAQLAARFAPQVPAADLAGQYWMRSGTAGFAASAAQHFFLPTQFTDAFGSLTRVEYDPRDLFIASTQDALGNTTRITKTAAGRFNFDYRVLAPREMQDINDNLSEVNFDALGLPCATALKGKGTEGDNLSGFSDALANPELADLRAFFVQAKPYDETQAKTWLGGASTRFVYYLGQEMVGGQLTWGAHPACACGIIREQHASQLGPGESSPVQSTFEYRDGLGSVVVKKIQAEPELEAPGQPLRWVASGKTILNNKGKPVKKYEPFFSKPAVGHRFEDPLEEGVTALVYYDAVGRVVRSEMPDGSFSRVEFSPWHVRSFDQNDTVRDSQWFSDRGSPNPDLPLPAAAAPDQRAAWLAAQHANTPGMTILDSLGREVFSVVHNRVGDVPGALTDEKYVTFTRLDAESKPLWIRDARGSLVMQYITPPAPNNQSAGPAGSFAPAYDIAGNLLFQHSMDAGERWTLNDAAGQPMLAWDSRGHLFHTDYDSLHRPTGHFVKGADPANPNQVIQYEKFIYGDSPTSGLTDAQSRALNLRGKTYLQYDSAGVITNRGRKPVTGADEAFDFKGNILRSTRQFVSDYTKSPNWLASPALESEIFTSSARYDALNRPTQLVAPHSSLPGTRFNVIQPGFNPANLLEQVNAWLSQSTEPAALLDPATANLKAVRNIDYNARGQRTRIEYNEAGHPIVSEYTYDPATFRLVHLVSTRPLHPEAGKRTLQDLSYTYDPSGNITEIRDAAQQPVFFNNTAVSAANRYTYDALYRLVRADGREHAAQNNIQRDANRFQTITGIPFPNSPEALQRYTETYEYDPVGNLLGMHHAGGGVDRWTRWYQYALDSNRLLATRAPGEGSKLPFYASTPGYNARYTYDAHGSITSMPHLPGMVWDFKDQLHATQRQVVNDAPPPAQVPESTYYVYDASGQRVRKITQRQNGSRRHERIYLGGFEVYRAYNGATHAVNLARETLHVMDDQQRIALVETRTDTPAPERLVRYQLGNHLGSAMLELDAQAQVITYEEYHPYGTTAYEAARSQTETPKRYRYTGKERDEETEFTYHGARYYAPWLARWTSSDPSGLKDGLNLYRYVSCNPVRLSDPNGRVGLPAEYWENAQAERDADRLKQFDDAEKKREDAALDAGARVDPPQPDYVGAGGEATFVMTEQQRQNEKAELPTAGALPQSVASKGMVATTGGTEVKEYIHREVVTGQKAAMRSNPVVMGALSWAFLATLFFNREAAGAILESVSGPEANSEIAQASELYTSIALSLGEGLVSAGGRSAVSAARSATGRGISREMMAFVKAFYESEGQMLNIEAKAMRAYIRSTYGGNPRLMVGISTTFVDGKQIKIVKVSDPKIWDLLKAEEHTWTGGLKLGKRPVVGEGNKLLPNEHVEIAGPKELIEEFGAEGVITGTAGPACSGNCAPRWKANEFPKVLHTNVPE